MTERRCDKCEFWDTSSESSIAEPGTTARCRAKAPTTDERTGLAMWPHTDQDDWCGDFRPSPSTENPNV